MKVGHIYYFPISFVTIKSYGYIRQLDDYYVEFIHEDGFIDEIPINALSNSYSLLTDIFEEEV